MGVDKRIELHSIDELATSLAAVLMSRRWLIGNSVGKCLDRFRGRSVASLPADRIRSWCSRYSEWKRTRLSDDGYKALSSSDVHWLATSLPAMNHAFNALLVSRRWKAGNFIVDTLRFLALRPRECRSVHHVRALFNRVSMDWPHDQTDFPARKVTLAYYYYRLGLVREKLGLGEQAVAAYQEAVRLGLRIADLYDRLGRAYIRGKQWRAATTAYQKAIAVEPTRARWLYNLGYAYERRRKWVEAVHAYECAIEVDPAHATWFYRLGKVRERARRVEEAYGTNQGSTSNLEDHWNGAISAYSAAINLCGTQGIYYFRLGNALEKINDIQGAITAYEKAVSIRPTKAQWWCRLGRARENASNFDRAVEAYRCALSLDPACSMKTRLAMSMLRTHGLNGRATSP